MNTQLFFETDQMIELSCEYLSVRWIWLYVIMISCTHFRVNPHYICVNIKELLALKRRGIWGLNDWNWNRTRNHLVCKGTLKHLAKLIKSLSWVVSTNLYRAFDCMLLTYHVRILEWIDTLYLPEDEGAPCLKKARYMIIKWLFGQTDEMT